VADFAPLPGKLIEAIARVAAALPEPSPGSHVALAFDRDRFAFAATVFAAWAKGHAVALPRNARRVNVAPVVAKKEVVLLAHDTGAGLGLDVPKLLANGDAPSVEVATIPFHGALTVFDAESTLHLTAEQCRALLAEALEAMALPRGAKVWNAFTAGAPSAFFPGVLAPLAAGCEFVDDYRLAHTVVAPAHVLRRLARNTDLTARQVVCADRVLDPATNDVFGDRGVRAMWTRDRGSSGVDLCEKRFDICEEIEDHALHDDGVDDVAVEDVEPGRVCQLVATRRDATAMLREPRDTGRDSIRFVLTLPRDQDGRLSRAYVLRQFGRLADGRTATRTLEIETLPNEGAAHRFRTTLPSTFFAFDGHFATYPVLSGAIQLHEVVMPCVRRAIASTAVEPAAFHDLKFLARIAPDDTIDVAITPSADRTTCEFTIACRDKKCSTGRVVLRVRERENTL